MSAVILDRSLCAGLFLDRGISRLRRNHFAEANADFDRVLQLVPDDPYAHWNKATALLSMGDYQNGFIEHDWGWRLFSWRKFETERLRALPVWHGAPGQRLLAYHELGLGDAVMAFRYLPALAQRCRSVTLVIEPALASLARRFGIEVVTALPDDLDSFDGRLQLFGVMSALQQTIESVPRAPYIAARWRQFGGKLGVCWSGRTQQMFTGSLFIDLLNGGDGYDLYSLQPGDAPPGVTALQANDFEDTAAVIEQMDHIVTVDTAVAHLAGAMGHRSTHVVLPFMADWRWWRGDVWYPALKTYRQPQPGSNWSVPFAQINEAVFDVAAPSRTG
jgi:hypothetical protein